MATLTAPALCLHGNSEEQPIPLFQLGCLTTLRISYWSCRAGNAPEDFDLTGSDIEQRAIASLGTKDLIDPAVGRKRFQQLEKKARHELARFSHPFPAAAAYFVPWDRMPELAEQLGQLQQQFEQAANDFFANFSDLRETWLSAHPDIPRSAYPNAVQLRQRFNFRWYSFKVAGADAVATIDDIEQELAGRQLRAEQLASLKQQLQSDCQQFASDYVLAFRKEIADFCDQIVSAGGVVHGKTLAALRRRIDNFHAMNVFNDIEAGAQLDQLKQQLCGVTGEDLKQQPMLATSLSLACGVLKQGLLDPNAVSSITGRLKRRVILD